jgi:alpha-1,2-mannosyltransferase
MTPPSSTASRRRLLGLVLALLPLGFMLAYTGIRGDNFDYGLYRSALLDVLHGGSVYDYAFYMPLYHTSMGFVYPPFASLVLLPLAMVSNLAGKTLLALGTAVLMMVALWGVFRLVDARRATAGRKEISLVVWAWITMPIMLSMPATMNMQLGQESFAVAALVIIDVLLLPPKWRGALVGLAGAIKLTPMIMVPYYLVTKQWRAALNSCVAFGVAALVSAIFRWPDSVRYWLVRDVISGSLGDVARWDNWSIYGVLSRLGVTGQTLTVVWVVASALTVGFAVCRAVRHYRQGQDLEATLLMGTAVALVTTVTWPHHLLFVLIGCVVLAIRRPLIGIPALLTMSIIGFFKTDLIGFVVVPLMLAFVIFGMPGDLRLIQQGKTDPELEPVCAGEPS